MTTRHSYLGAALFLEVVTSIVITTVSSNGVKRC